MVVVVDAHPDVVQHAGGPQQLALARVARVQAGGGECRRTARAPAARRARCARGRRGTGRRGSAPTRGARRRTAAGRRRGGCRRTRPRAGRPRSPRWPRSRRASSTASTTAAPARIEVGARVLDPRHLGAVARAPGRRAARRARERVARDRRSPARRTPARPRPAARRRRGCARSRRCRRCARRPPAATARPQLGGDVRRAARAAASWTPCPSPRPKRSVIRTAPSGHDCSSRAWRDATRTSCIEPPPRSSTAPSARVVELTAAR